MKFIIASLCLLAISITAFSQSYFGLYAHGNTGGQWLSNPNRPQDGTMAFGFGQGYGGGVVYTVMTNPWLSLSYRINYLQRAHKPGISNPGNNKLHRFHYTGLDQLLNLHPLPSIPVYFQVGLKTARMIANNLPTEISYSHDQPILRDNYHRWNLGAICGLGYRYDKMFFEGGMNWDIAPSYSVGNVLIKHYIWYLNIGAVLF